MTSNLAQPDNHLQAKGGRQCLLPVGAGGHRCCPVVPGQFEANRFQNPQVSIEYGDGCPYLENFRGIQDVLGGCPIVNIFPVAVAACPAETTQQRHERITAVQITLMNAFQVQQFKLCLPADLLGCLLRYNPHLPLNLCQGRLKIQPTLVPRFFIKNLRQLNCAEHSWIYLKVNGVGGHRYISSEK